MGQDRAKRLVASPVALPEGLTRIQAHVLEQFTQTVALKQVMMAQEDAEAAVRLIDVVLAVRYRDCVVQRVDGAADVIRTYIRSPDSRVVPTRT